MTATRKLIIVSGPSGCGKTSVVAELVTDPRFVRSVSATTRRPRGAERDGRDYHILDPDAFRRGIEEDRFLEWAEVYGCLYGTPREPIEGAIAAGLYPVLNIDTQGARTLRGKGVEGLYVFILPPSLTVLEDRLRRRGTDSEESIRRRLALAETEMAESGGYDVSVVNDDVGRAAGAVRRLALEGAM